MTVYDAVLAHHQIHGDDFGSLRSRVVRYEAALSLFPDEYESLLDVGCGSGEFRKWWGGSADYTGLDLLRGQNVLDHDEHADVVVGLGVLYRIPPGEQTRLIEHMWSLADRCLIVQTLTESDEPGEYPADPSRLSALAWRLTKRIALLNHYLPNDCTLAMYRELG